MQTILQVQIGSDKLIEWDGSAALSAEDSAQLKNNLYLAGKVTFKEEGQPDLTIASDIKELAEKLCFAGIINLKLGKPTKVALDWDPGNAILTRDGENASVGVDGGKAIKSTNAALSEQLYDIGVKVTKLIKTELAAGTWRAKNGNDKEWKQTLQNLTKEESKAAVALNKTPGAAL